MPGVPLLAVRSNSPVYAAEECCTLMPGRISSVLPTLAETVCFYTLEHLALEHCDYLWVWGFFVQFKVTEITWWLCHREWCFNIRRLTVCALRSARWFEGVTFILLDLGAGSTAIAYGPYEIVSRAYHPQIDLGCHLGRQQAQVKGHLQGAKKKAELFDHVDGIETQNITYSFLRSATDLGIRAIFFVHFKESRIYSVQIPMPWKSRVSQDEYQALCCIKDRFQRLSLSDMFNFPPTHFILDGNTASFNADNRKDA